VATLDASARHGAGEASRWSAFSGAALRVRSSSPAAWSAAASRSPAW
jgi:hypothetical protein